MSVLLSVSTRTCRISKSCDVPDSFQGNSKFLETINNALQFSPVLVTPPALVVSKCEVLLHCRKSSCAHLVRFGDLVLSWTSVEVKINAATESSPSDV